MLWATWHPAAQTQRNDPTRGVTLVMLAMATSLDALVVGVSFGLTGITVWYPSLLIGMTTSAVCFLAILLGNRLRFLFARWAGIAGGVVVLLIALRIFLSQMY